MDTMPQRESSIRVITHDGAQHVNLIRLLSLLVAWAVVLTVVPTAAYVIAPGTAARLIAALGSVPRPGVPPAGATWLFALPPHARTSVDVDLAEVAPVARPLIQRLAGMISIDDRVAVCRAPAVSCSSSGSGLDGRWGVHLDAGTTAFTFPSNRFLVYHEIGHAEWGLLLGAVGQRGFAQAVRRALGGRSCINDQGRPCAVLPEMFADEFARYVGGFAVSMSYYCTRHCWTRSRSGPSSARLRRHVSNRDWSTCGGRPTCGGRSY